MQCQHLHCSQLFAEVFRGRFRRQMEPPRRRQVFVASVGEPGYARVCRPAWLDHRPAGERSRLSSFPAATAGQVALKDIASLRPLSGLYSATAKPGPSTKQSECTLFNVCENDFQILLRQSNQINSGLRLSGRARWYGEIYICMLAESGLPEQTISWLAGNRVSPS